MHLSPFTVRRHAVPSIHWALVLLIVGLTVGLSARVAPDVSARTVAGGGGAFAPTPCPAMDWRYADPGFEALPGARALYGQYEGGLYRMEIPDNWNGGLVLAAHGFTTTAGEFGDLLRVGSVTASANALVASGLPYGLREHLIERGFAWAASSYRCNGYIPGQGLVDTMALRGLFATQAGRLPRRTYLTGVSMGGHITVLGMHEFPAAFDGALAFCAAGPALFDFFLATGAAAEVVTGERFTTPATVQATTARMLEITGQPANLTAQGRQLASIEVNISGGPRPFAVDGLPLDGNRFGANIVGGALAGDTSLLSRAATNADTSYGIGSGLGLSADELNAAARRVTADESLRGPAGPYNELKPFSGRIEHPMIALHTTGDMFVPFFLEQVLRRSVNAAGKGDLLVQRIIRSPGHCTFSGPEAVRAFDDMISWVENGTRPAGDNVMDDLSDAGRTFTTPLRPNDPGTIDIAPVATL